MGGDLKSNLQQVQNVLCNAQFMGVIDLKKIIQHLERSLDIS